MYVVKSTLAATGLCIAAAESMPEPLGQFAQFGVAGLLIFLVFWIFAKTLPEIQRSHSEQLKQQSDTNTANIKVLVDANAENMKQFTEYLRSRKRTGGTS